MSFMLFDFIKNVQLAAATSIADISLLAGFMLVNTGQVWVARNVAPQIPGGPGSWPQMIGAAALDAAADLSKFILYENGAKMATMASSAVGA